MRIGHIALAESPGNARVQVREPIQLENIPLPLSDDSALMVSAYQIRTPAGHEIEGKGITPDLQVDATQNGKPLEPEAWAIARDPQ